MGGQRGGDLATRNPNLIPTIILLGSFLVPAAFVSYAFDRADQVLSAQRIFAAFVCGGVLGVLGASLLEAAFLGQPSVPTYLELLHGLWDAARPIAVWLTLLLTGSPVQWLLIRLGHAPAVTSAQVHLFTAISWTLLGLDALVGLLVLRGRWRRASAADPAATTPAHPLLAAASGQR